VSGDEAGFTLLETAISMVLLAIVGLGIASVFFYAAKNNSSARDRELAMAVAQQQMEQLRNVSFKDSSLARTVTVVTPTAITRAGRLYTVQTTIMDSNFVNGTATTKRIIVRVTPWSDGSSWARNVSSVFGSVTMISERSAQTIGPNRDL
jgi:Tfp pilus assembly protein PilV